MDIWQAVVFGAIGGLIVEVMNAYELLTTWQSDRRMHRRSVRHDPAPELGTYLDLRADAPVALSRVLLGAVAGLILSDQLTGAVAAVAVGAAAPGLLKQIGRTKAPDPPQEHAETPTPSLGPGVPS